MAVQDADAELGWSQGSELPPKPLTLLSQHVSLPCKMRNPALKTSTLYVVLGGEFDDWALK